MGRSLLARRPRTWPGQLFQAGALGCGFTRGQGASGGIQAGVSRLALRLPSDVHRASCTGLGTRGRRRAG